MQFESIVGQRDTVNSFIQSVQNNRLSHALLLKGSGGVGKLPLAVAMAAYLNCNNPTIKDSCGLCPSCSKIRQGIHPDVHFLLPTIAKSSGTPDDFLPDFRAKFLQNPYLSLAQWGHALDAENKQLAIPISAIRELKKKITLKAFEGKYKVVIVWHAEKIGVDAANAFLKLLEEPPERTILILTVEDTMQLLVTVLSRCQQLYVKHLETPSIISYLEKQGVNTVQAQESGLMADGSMATALDLLNQAQDGFSQRFVSWMRICYKGSYREILKWVDEIASQPREYQKLFLAFALEKFRQVLFLKNGIKKPYLNEDDFLINLGKTLHIDAPTKVRELLDKTIFYITRNANATMVFMILSLEMNKILMTKENTTVS